MRMIAASEPGPDAEDEAHVAGALARPPREIRRLAEFPFVDDAEIGREFPADLVAQPEAGIDIGKAGADQAGRDRPCCRNSARLAAAGSAAA